MGVKVVVGFGVGLEVTICPISNPSIKLSSVVHAAEQIFSSPRIDLPTINRYSYPFLRKISG